MWEAELKHSVCRAHTVPLNYKPLPEAVFIALPELDAGDEAVHSAMDVAESSFWICITCCY